MTTDFGAALIHLRQKAGLNQDELAPLADITQNYLSALEKGNKPGSRAVRQALADALKWPLDAMITLGALLIDGVPPDRAERMALQISKKEAQPPALVQDLEELWAVRVFVDGHPGRRTIYVDPSTIGGRDRDGLAGHDFNGQVVLVDHGDTELLDGAWYLLRGPLRVRQAVLQNGAVLLAGLHGEHEAFGAAWADICEGRALWMQNALV